MCCGYYQHSGHVQVLSLEMYKIAIFSIQPNTNIRLFSVPKYEYGIQPWLSLSVTYFQCRCVSRISYSLHTHNTQLFYGCLNSGTTRVSRYQKKHSPTHTYRGHQSSLIWFLHLQQFMASSLFSVHTWQSFSTISKFSLVYRFAWHPQLHTPYISSPNRCLLFTTHAHTIATCFAVVPSFSQPFTWNSILKLNATHPSDHSHLCLLKCHIIFLFYGPGLTSMQHTTLHTTAIQSVSHF